MGLTTLPAQPLPGTDLCELVFDVSENDSDQPLLHDSTHRPETDSKPRSMHNDDAAGCNSSAALQVSNRQPAEHDLQIPLCELVFSNDEDSDGELHDQTSVHSKQHAFESAWTEQHLQEDHAADCSNSPPDAAAVRSRQPQETQPETCVNAEQQARQQTEHSSEVAGMELVFDCDSSSCEGEAGLELDQTVPESNSEGSDSVHVPSSHQQLPPSLSQAVHEPSIPESHIHTCASPGPGRAGTLVLHSYAQLDRLAIKCICCLQFW